MKLPAAGVHPVQRWRGELVAEFGWLPVDRAVAAAGAADVDDGPVRLAYHAGPVPIHAKLRPGLGQWLIERAAWPGADTSPALFLNTKGGRLSARAAVSHMPGLRESLIARAGT